MKKINIITFALLISMSLGLTITNANSQTTAPTVVSAPVKTTVQYTLVDPVAIVASPQKFLNKNIKINFLFVKKRSA